MEYPNIEIAGKKYWLVGCRKCQSAEWNLYMNGEGKFVARCVICEHTEGIELPNVTTEPDEEE